MFVGLAGLGVEFEFDIVARDQGDVLVGDAGITRGA